MKGIILAGGTGSRLYPLTKVTNKHLLPVGRKPMIFWPIEKLTRAGVKNILVVTGVDHMGDVVNLLGSGRDFGCEFTYKVQDQAGGIAQALGLAREFAREERMVVILGDNIFEDDLAPHVDAYRAQPAGARILLKEVHDPERYGVAELRGDRIASIEEKPKVPRSRYAVTGIYMYDPQVFEIIGGLKPSGRGELEISDVNSRYLELGQLGYGLMRGWWTDAGTFDSLDHAGRRVVETWGVSG
jgi:glucose-1-phosphate thymidylyltransferase